jgi:outer membrane lipoprotein-sorting protein
MNSVGNGRKTPLLFSTFKFEYERENGNSIVGNENELMVFRKRTNLSGIMSKTVDVRKLNTKY